MKDQAGVHVGECKPPADTAPGLPQGLAHSGGSAMGPRSADGFPDVLSP